MTCSAAVDPGCTAGVPRPATGAHLEVEKTLPPHPPCPGVERLGTLPEKPPGAQEMRNVCGSSIGKSM